jgi:hypothetical protein
MATKPKYSRQGFEAEMRRQWAEASRIPWRELTQEWREAMWRMHVELDLPPTAIAAGVADALKQEANKR